MQDDKKFLRPKIKLLSKITCDDPPKVCGRSPYTDVNKQSLTTPNIQGFSSTDPDPSFEELVKAGLVWKFFDFLGQNDLLLEFEEVWAPIEVSSGTSELPQDVIGHDAVLKLAKLYKFSRDEFQQLDLGAFGDATGVALDFSDLGPFDCVEFFSALDMLIKEADLPVLRTVSRTLYKFCDDLDPNFAEKGLLYPILQKLIFTEDVEVLTDACWALGNSLIDTVDDIQHVIDSDVCRRVSGLLNNHSSAILIPVLFILGKIVSGTDEQTQYLINLNVLPRLRDLLKKFDNDSITKLACFIIATITKHRPDHVQAVIHSHLVGPLINLLKGKIDCKEDAIFAITNCATNASPKQFKRLFDVGCIKPLCGLLSSENFYILINCLMVLTEILKRREADKNFVDECKRIIGEVGGLENIRKLRSHANPCIFKCSVDLLRKFWLKEEYASILPDELRGPIV